MLPRNISHNFLVGNYGGSNGCVDNDDGSLWFDNNNNFATYGHQKFKVGRSYGSWDNHSCFTACLGFATGRRNSFIR